MTREEPPELSGIKLAALALTNGLVVAVLVIITQVAAAPALARRFGPDASYISFLSAFAWILVAAGAAIIAVAWKCRAATSAAELRNRLAWLWVWQAAGIVALVVLSAAVSAWFAQRNGFRP